MEGIAQQQPVSLFEGQLPSIEQIQNLSGWVLSSEMNKINFAKEVEQNLGKTGGDACLSSGIGLYILGRYDQAIEKLEKSNDCHQKYIFIAYAQRQLSLYDDALSSFEQAAKSGADTPLIAVEKAETLRRKGDLEGALGTIEKADKNSCDYYYQSGYILEKQGKYTEAVNNYKKALEINPNHQEVLFRLAYRCDLFGDEDAAIDYYKQITSNSPVYVNALLNLAVLYEDMEKYNNALQCVEKVLNDHPNHARALMFRKDITSSMTMFFDEEKEKKKDRRVQILETPITDFELSVRSRNCFRKMGIHTLGDLLNITEVELLSYKNFGETSLREIKNILDSKGLQLGLALQDSQNMPLGEIENEQAEEDQGLLNKPVDDLRLSIRAQKCLKKLNINTLGELTRRTEAELLGCKNFGVTSLNEIKKAISSLGLSLRMLD
jgi:DNA-directed RNA polymerase subunit alpha